MGDPRQGRSRVRDLLAVHGLRPDRSLGQNFLTDPNLVAKIVDVADVAGADVVEIGAGTGTLTSALAAVAGRVIAYEIDRDLAGILDETVGPLPNVELRFADAAATDLAEHLDPGPWTMVANLPYNVGTGILLDALRHTPAIERFTVMVQREVADRLLASPGSKVYGLPSVVVGLHASGRRALVVPPDVFEPMPNVESAVVVLERLHAPADAERAIDIAAAAFGQRRKMLRRSLGTLWDDPVGILERAGVDPTLRPEQLAPVEYVAIATAERDG